MNTSASSIFPPIVTTISYLSDDDGGGDTSNMTTIIPLPSSPMASDNFQELLFPDAKTPTSTASSFQQRFFKFIKIIQEILMDLSQELDYTAIGLITLSLLIVVFGIMAIICQCRIWKKSQKISKNFDTSSWLEYKLDRTKLANSSHNNNNNKNLESATFSRHFNDDDPRSTPSSSSTLSQTLFSSSADGPSSSFTNANVTNTTSCCDSSLTTKSQQNIKKNYFFYPEHVPIQKSLPNLHMINPYVPQYPLHHHHQLFPKLSIYPIWPPPELYIHPSQMIMPATTITKMTGKRTKKDQSSNQLKKSATKERKFKSGILKKLTSSMNNMNKKKVSKSSGLYYPNSKKLSSDMQPFLTTKSNSTHGTNSFSRSSSHSHKNSISVSSTYREPTNPFRDYETQTVEINLTGSEDGGDNDSVKELTSGTSQKAIIIKNKKPNTVTSAVTTVTTTTGNYYRHRQRQRPCSNNRKQYGGVRAISCSGLNVRRSHLDISNTLSTSSSSSSTLSKNPLYQEQATSADNLNILGNQTRNSLFISSNSNSYSNHQIVNSGNFSAQLSTFYNEKKASSTPPMNVVSKCGNC